MSQLAPLAPLPGPDLEQVLGETARLWPELQGARIFLTGGTGFFGRWMLESLLAADRRFGLGVRVVALSRDPERFLRRAPHCADEARVRWCRGSVASLSPQMLSGEKFDLIIHLATEGDLAATLADPAAATGVIAGGTRRVLEAAGLGGARRFLFASSGAVYGRQPPAVDLLDEEFRGEVGRLEGGVARAIGGEAKRQAELLCATSAPSGLEVVIARGFSFAGPGLPLDGKFAFGNFLADALAGRRIILTGDGTPVRSYLYASDLTVWLWTLLLRGAPGRAYNVGSEIPVSIRALAEAIRDAVGGGEIEVGSRPVADRMPERYVPSTARARRELDLRQTVGLPEAIRRTIDWQRGANRA